MCRPVEIVDLQPDGFRSLGYFRESVGDHVFELARPLSLAPNLHTVHTDLGHQSQQEHQAWDEALGCTLVASTRRLNNFRHDRSVVPDVFHLLFDPQHQKGWFKNKCC